MTRFPSVAVGVRQALGRWGRFARQLLLIAILLATTKMASAVSITWLPVGNPGNANSPSGKGAVSYSYNISAYDVTNNQYVEFLNSNDATGTNLRGLYHSGMGTAPYGGIAYNSAAPSGSKYDVTNGAGNHPVNYVNFYDTLRFANWLNNGQAPGSTETGAYTLLGGTPVPSNSDSIGRGPILRNAGAHVFLPSFHEWYKAAYYNPATSSYFQYPTSSDTAPTATGPTATPNSANYLGVLGNLTDVGAYSGTTSPYGALDMGGNVWQWNELFSATFDPIFSMAYTYRNVEGGSYTQFSGGVSALSSSVSNGLSFDPTASYSNLGFRVASVPEPSTVWLLSLGIFAFLCCARVSPRSSGRASLQAR